MNEHEARFYNVALYIELSLILNAPRDTGNLALGSIRIIPEMTKPNEYVVRIGGEVAPYAPYTNEPWISPKWNGKKNPNERWVQNTIAMIKPTIMQMMGGKIKMEDIIAMNAKLQDQIDVERTENKLAQIEEERLNYVSK